MHMSIASIFTNTHPYLDPGSGSFIIQILIAALLGAGVFIKIYWRKIKSFITRQPYTNETDDQENKQL
jgi:hypothetical protein